LDSYGVNLTLVFSLKFVSANSPYEKVRNMAGSSSDGRKSHPIRKGVGPSSVKCRGAHSFAFCAMSGHISAVKYTNPVLVRPIQVSLQFHEPKEGLNGAPGKQSQ